MDFWKQLRLLLWKNITLRKRQPIRFLLEISWPVVLLALLALVRTRNLQGLIPECHFDEKALPSAGILPLLQSYICTFNNTCKRSSTDDVYGTVNMYHDSIISKIFSILENMFQNETLQNSTSDTVKTTVRLLRIAKELANVARVVPQDGMKFRDVFSVSSPDFLRSLNFSATNVSEAMLDGLLDAEFRPFALGDVSQFLLGHQLFCDTARLVKVLKFNDTLDVTSLGNALCSVPASSWLMFLGPSTNFTRVSKFSFPGLSDLPFMFKVIEAGQLLHQLQQSSEALAPFKTVFDEIQETYTSSNMSGLQFIGKFICGKNAEIFRVSDGSQSMAKRLRETQMTGNNVPLKKGDDTTGKRRTSNSSSQYCTEVFDFFENNTRIAIRFLWKPLKSFVLGKLLYTPDTPLTRKIIKRMNQTFERVDGILWAGRAIGKMLPEFSMLLDMVLNNSMGNQTVDLGRTLEMLNFFPGIQGLTGFVSGAGSEWFKNMRVNASVVGELRSTLALVGELLGNVTDFMECVELDKFMPMTNESQLNSYGGDLVDNDTFWAGIVFDNLAADVFQNATHIPSFVRYKIRYDVEKVDSTIRVQDRVWGPHPRRNPLTDLKYWTYGFLQLQDVIERALMSEMLNTSTDLLPGLYLQQFPYPCYIEDTFFMAISRNFPLLMTLAWVYTAAMTVKSMVYEKEKRLKETMMMMGLGSGANWISWFLETFTVMQISIVFTVLILYYGKILMHSNPFIIYIFLVCFSLSTIAFSFFLSVFFSKANVAAAAGGILFFCTFMPYSLLVLWEDRISLTVKVFTCFIPNVAFGWGSNILARFEEMGLGVQFSNIGTSPLDKDSFNLVHCLIMLLGDALVLFILAWYIEAVMPGQYGIPRPWYFPLSPSYWLGRRDVKYKDLAAGPSEDCRSSESSNFEPEPRDNHLRGIEIRDLKKVYTNGKLAVDGLSLNVYEGITALLGHNGAGKTTTFSILCGLFPASSGTAKIYGYDVNTEMDQIRKNFGFCPQHNVLWDQMTVQEHLYFYGSLKLSDPLAIEKEIDTMITHVGLPHKRHERTINLSGGMQRKLSVAIAYIGGARVVLLDEPTAGVDPWARRGIWNLLIRFRKERTTIMSTHFHGEADTLADRIAVIADGKLICGGSPVFLKARFGNGYHLTLVKASAETNVDEVTRFVQSRIPEALLVDNVGAEFAFVLPSTASRDGRFEILFEALDANLGFLEISSYGVRDTSLEEVFLRVMESHDNAKPLGGEFSGKMSQERMLSRRRLSNPVVTEPYDDLMPPPQVHTSPADLADFDQINLPLKRLHGSRLAIHQMKAMHIKRFHNLRRSKKSFFCEILLPALFVCLAMIVTLLTPIPLEMPPLELTPWLYGPPNYVFFANDRPSDESTSKMIQHLYEGPGIGTKCMANSPVSGKTCAVPIVESDKNHLVPDFNVSRAASASCSCASGGQQCSADAGGPMPPCVMLGTSDLLCNMTGRNITDWLVKTSKQYDSSRYGGFSFGEIDSFARFNFSHWGNVIANLLDSANLTGDPKKGTLTGSLQQVMALMSQMFQYDNIKVWFNNRGWASSVSYVNAINNVLLRSRLKPGQDPFKYGIMAINHPLNRTEEQMEDQIMKESAKALLHAVCIIFAMSFVPASFVMFLIEENVSGSKNLQFLAKVKPWLYWVSTYTWDICNYFLTAVICILIFVAFNEQAYVSSTSLPALVCLLALYGFAAIPMMYIPSFFFRIPSSAFVALACMNLFLGIVSTVTVFILELLDDEELQFIASILRQAFLVLPHYCLGRGLMDLAIHQVKADVFARFGQKIEESPFDWTFAGRNIAGLCIQGMVFFGLTLLIEYGFFWKPKRYVNGMPPSGPEDKDVAKERIRVFSGKADDSVLKVMDLTKVFRQRKRVNVAVDRITVGVGKGECFGLLGVNGAGKTTTFKMLTGNILPTSGDAFINGHSVATDLDNARRYIGYCPQFDAIHNLLTGREHLEFYARIHGVEEQYVRKASEQCLKRLHLTAYAGRCAGTYSGGNKRKLSTAIALIGDPDMVFLDEPTTGMDPKARRFLWNCILDMLREGRSVTLTSHSLEECENLCTKIAIMVNGRFQCIGSLQHLKSRFGFGYSVIIRCGPASVDKVCEFMETSFPGARMQEKHYNTVQYRIPLRGIKLSQIFGAIERNRALLEIEDASVNQTNLEDIFIEFAKHQTDLAADEVLPDEQDLIVETSVDTRAYDASSVTGSLVTADSSLSDGRLTRSDGYSFVSKSTPRISDPLLPPPVISPLHPESTIV